MKLCMVLICGILLGGCGRASDPVRDLIRDLERYPEYSLILHDLKVEDGFMPDYALQFKVLTASGQRISGRDTLVYEEKKTNWLTVTETEYVRYENFVGMVVASKSLNGQRTGSQQAYPAGYQYVGNPSYGFWGGGGFWQFYGQYALMRDLMGGWNVGRSDWEGYRRNREQGRPYYGPRESNGQSTFGTRGSQTKKTRPGFYNRQVQRRQTFSNKVSSRMGQTRTGSSGWGRTSSRSFGK
ncbi:MAG: hypothetical protein VX670_06780 [Candidatus Latescibacterota bacterium]|nr:hypothetical protein [Candidatus Latescibacterota bacterium]MEE2628174.1 hypothetical protein [Candidatus Latescibacterota bacterium]